MKSHHDCFTASEAITFLRDHLKECDHFNVDKITRFQALSLLRKYHESNIVERVKIAKNNEELKDNNELFRFTIEANENLPFLSITKSVENLMDVVSNSSSLDEQDEAKLALKMDIYKQLLWENLNDRFEGLSEHIKLEWIDSSTVYNNIIRVNTNGVVRLADKNEDLPQWVMSAMKCLANCKFPCLFGKY